MPAAARPNQFAGLRVPDGASLLFSAQGVGDQIYTSARDASHAGHFEWVLKAPRARLFNNAHRPIGRHYGGPTWAGLDGSRVVGAASPRQRVDAPEPGNIPWLVLEAISHSGTGDFSRVAYVLRVETVGGMAPARPPKRPGQEAVVKYRATYLFFTAAAP